MWNVNQKCDELWGASLLNWEYISHWDEMLRVRGLQSRLKTPWTTSILPCPLNLFGMPFVYICNFLHFKWYLFKSLGSEEGTNSRKNEPWLLLTPQRWLRPTTLWRQVRVFSLKRLCGWFMLFLLGENIGFILYINF